MGSPVYFTLHIKGVPVADEDLVTHNLFEAGAGGVQENLSFTQQERNYLPKVIEAEIKNLIAYFEEPPSIQWLESFQVEYPHIQVQVEEHETVDWLQNWKDQWKPFELINDIWIVPDWHKDSFRPDKGHRILIEPGMAFGTGTHATTQLAAQLIDKIQKQVGVSSLVDVGTGSGILSLLAHHLDVEKIFAYDNDPESKRVFQENIEKNQASRAKWCEPWAQELKGQIDLTVANIIDGVLLNLKTEFQKVNSPYYIFTGILAEREAAFLEEMTENWPLQILTRLEKDEWVGFLMKQES